jgi:predicted DNA-binding transcriptional regulator AlpA
MDYKVDDLTEMGFGNRTTIWRRVKKSQFPKPIKLGTSPTSPVRWSKEDIDNYVVELRKKAGY